MRWLRNILLAAVFAALICLARSSLIVGPEPPREQAGAPMPESACLLTIFRQETENTAEDGSPTDSRRAEKLPPTLSSAEEPAVTVCGGNGWPLQSRSWFKTMYLVCPPEGAFG